MKIEYLHASVYGNGAEVAAEFKKQMAARDVTVDVHHIREVQSQALGFHHQLLQLLLQQPLLVTGTGLRRLGHHGADTRMNLKPPLLNEMLDDPVRGVVVDLQIGRQGPDGRKGLARPVIAADESLHRGEDDLIEDGLAGLELKAWQCHGVLVQPVHVARQSACPD